MYPVSEPPSVGPAFRSNQLDSLFHPRVALRPGAPKVVERPQHVVPPVVGERDVEECRVGHLTRGLAAEQPSFQQILLATAPRFDHLERTTGCPLELSQAIEHVDGGVDRRHHRPVLGLAVPPTLGQALREDPFHDLCHVDTKIRPRLDRPAVDARFHVAVETTLAIVFPPPVLGHQLDGTASRF